MCQTIVSIALDTATSALSLPRRLATRRYLEPRKERVLAAARAEMPSCAARYLLPWPVAAGLDRAPDWLTDGQRLAQDTRFAGVGKQDMSAPTSARITSAPRWARPSMSASRRIWSW